MAGKLLIVSAPSGSGKSTLINYLIQKKVDITFSISATSRLPRGNEQNGREYYFLTPEDFRKHIDEESFLEYEEVYENCFYGTLKEPVDKLLAEGKNVVFDVDVVGGVNIKRYYGNRALSVFVQPPSVEELRRRLTGRATDTPEVIEKRISKAEFELNYAGQFDKVIINDDLEKAQVEMLNIVTDFINQP